MSLERKDLRLKLDADTHAGLDVLADVDGKQLSDLAEEIIGDYVRRRIHAATVVAARASRLGLSGNRRESAGISGIDRE
jgi:hypothetical protein